MVEWSKMLPREIREAASAMPKVLGSWRCAEFAAPGVRYYKNGGIWSRYAVTANAGAAWSSPCSVQPFIHSAYLRVEDGWHAVVNRCGDIPEWYVQCVTANEAMAAVDEHLQLLGYVLDDEPEADEFPAKIRLVRG